MNLSLNSNYFNFFGINAQDTEHSEVNGSVFRAFGIITKILHKIIGFDFFCTIKLHLSKNNRKIWSLFTLKQHLTKFSVPLVVNFSSPKQPQFRS